MARARIVPVAQVGVLHMLVVTSAVSCRDAPTEPLPAARVTSAQHKIEPSVVWRAPAGWQLEKAAPTGEYRAKYTVPAQGDAAHPAELLVTAHAKDARGALEDELRSLASSFEGPGSESVAREERDKDGFHLTHLDVAGTYRFPMGPRMGKSKRAAAHVLKENWRALGCAVVAPDRSAWFFRLVGPRDSVAAARSAFVTMVESLECRDCAPPR